MGMAAQGSHRRVASLQGTYVCHRQFPDVHAGLRAARQHASVAAVYADAAGLHSRTSGKGAFTRRLCHPADVAAGGIPALALRRPLADGDWTDRSLTFAVSHDE